MASEQPRLDDVCAPQPSKPLSRNPLGAVGDARERAGDILSFVEAAFRNKPLAGFPLSHNEDEHRARREEATIACLAENAAGEGPALFDDTSLVIATPDRAPISDYIGLLSVAGKSLSDKGVFTEAS